MQRNKAMVPILVAFCLSLSACNLPTVKAGDTPMTEKYTNYILDCSITNANQKNPIQPPNGCDRWQDNRYERPFNSEKQDTYYPDMDILFSALGQSDGWYLARIVLRSLRPGEQVAMGTYGIELDTDEDLRGDYLIVGTPQIHSSQDWSPSGVQAWHDSNNDVGNQKPGLPDGPYRGNGYDELRFDQGQPKGPDSALMRVYGQDSHVYLEIAFKPGLVDNPTSFYWSAWADEGVRKPAAFDYHDSFDLATAGEVYQNSPNFPAKAIADVDNTCLDGYGVEPPAGDSHFCRGDPSVSYIPPNSGCEDPQIQDSTILCPVPVSETATLTATCPPLSISINSPTPGGPFPCGTRPPCVYLVIGNATPDPAKCTPTGTSTLEGGTPDDTPTCAPPSLSRWTPTPGGPPPCWTIPPCADIVRAGETPETNRCTPTATLTAIYITFTPKVTKRPHPHPQPDTTPNVPKATNTPCVFGTNGCGVIP